MVHPGENYRQMSIDEIGQDPESAINEPKKLPSEKQSSSKIKEPSNETISAPEVTESDKIREQLKSLNKQIAKLLNELGDYKYKEGQYLEL